jgi:hypothetical protein
MFLRSFAIFVEEGVILAARKSGKLPAGLKARNINLSRDWFPGTAHFARSHAGNVFPGENLIRRDPFWK